MIAEQGTLLTGAGRGVGKTIAETFAEEGGRAVIRGSSGHRI